MTEYICLDKKPKIEGFTQLPNFLFESSRYSNLSSDAKVLYAMLLRRTELSRKNAWADEAGRIYIYFTIEEVTELLHCGRQKAVNTMQELKIASLISVKKQGCGRPNRIYPRIVERVQFADDLHYESQKP